MKKIILRILSYTLLVLAIIFMTNKIRNLNIALDNSINNEKAYAAENSWLNAENSWLKESNRVFKLSIEQLEYFSDSLMLKMKKVANENKVKDNKIKALQYQLEHFSKKDTIVIRDTIFREPGFVLDTCIVDKWNRSCLHLSYPGTIALSNEYNNEKYITLSSHKEPIKPRKWFLPRWFTRKHTVIEVIIIDQNPYVTTPKQRYIEIIDN